MSKRFSCRPLAAAILSIAGLMPISDDATATISAPTHDVWTDGAGNLYYQKPVRHSQLVSDISASVRSYERFPYIKLVPDGNGGFILQDLSFDAFMALQGTLSDAGERLQGDFDGDGIEDLLLMTDAGESILISRGQAALFDTTSLGGSRPVKLQEISALVD